MLSWLAFKLSRACLSALLLGNLSLSHVRAVPADWALSKSQTQNQAQDDAQAEQAPKSSQDDPPDTGEGAADETPEGGLEHAGVVPAETHVLPNPIGRTSSGDGRYFVGAVSVNDGSSLFIGGNRLTGNSRWLDVLRTGMWVEANGHWESDVFVADDVKVLGDEDWAYYRGPAAALGVGEGTVEAWTANGIPTFEGVRTVPDTGQAVHLVTYFDGEKLVAIPPSFASPPVGAAPGWLELKGYFDGENIVWESAAPFP